MNESDHGPWWSVDKPALKSLHIRLSHAIGLAIVAGIAGSLLANFLNLESIFHQKINLVSVNKAIERKPDSIAGIAQRVLPSVVSISTRSSSGTGTGSGFIINSTGYILTNNHVVDSVANSDGTITVTLNDGQSIGATIVGRDTAYDLAVIKVSAQNLPALVFGDSDKIEVGDPVIAIGSPLGLTGTVTTGIISAKNRAVSTGGNNGESSFMNALQTDAAINPGNSGGPLVDMTGAVVGVNSAIASLGASYGSQAGSIGLGFAIPINQARKTAEQLISTGKSVYPIMGISIEMGFAGPGAKIAQVPSGLRLGGPADKAGLKQGDVITVFGGKKIANADQLIIAIRAKNVGDKVLITYERSGITHQTSVVLVAGP